MKFYIKTQKQAYSWKSKGIAALPKYTATILATAILLTKTTSGVTIPEGIRGFTYTYGAWIESVIAKSPLKDLIYGEDYERYNNFQRLLIASERLAEDNNQIESFSYLKRAGYALEDIYKELKNQYDWKQEDDIHNEDSAAWTKEAQNAWALYKLNKLQLILHEEYNNLLAGRLDADYRGYCESANRNAQSISKESDIHNNIAKTYLPQYLKELCSEWQRATQPDGSYDLKKIVEEYAALPESITPSDDYWKQKRIKRIIILFASYGYPEKSFAMSETLLEEDPNAIPFQLRHNLYLLNGKFKEAEAQIQENLKRLDLKEKNNWGQYISLQMALINQQMFSMKLDEAFQQIDRVSGQLQNFIASTYLSSDVHDFIENRIFDFELKKLIIERIQNKDHPENNTINLDSIQLPDKPEKMLIELHANLKLSEENGKLEEKNGKAQVSAYPYLQFQSHLQNNLPQAEKILSNYHGKTRKENPPWIYFARLDLYLEKLAANPASFNKKEFLELWNQAVISGIQTSSLSFLLQYGFNPDFSIKARGARLLRINPPQMNLETKWIVLRTLSSLEQWHKKMVIPPAYFGPAENQIRRLYMQTFKMDIPGPAPEDGSIDSTLLTKSAPGRAASEPSVGFSLGPTGPTMGPCSASACWAIYPLEGFYYSLAWRESSIISENFSENELPYSEIHDFYAAYTEINLQQKEGPTQQAENFIQELSAKFGKALGSIGALTFASQSQKDDKIALYLFDHAHSLPIEALYIQNTTRLAAAASIIRKAGPDILNERFSCQVIRCISQYRQAARGESSTPSHFFFGLGARSAPMLLPLIGSEEELIEIEHLFAEKELLTASANIGQKLKEALRSAKDIIFHITGGWIPENEGSSAALTFDQAQGELSMNYIQNFARLPYIIFSKNQIISFDGEEFPVWTSVLSSYHHQQARYLITSTALTPKEFRQAFFYDFYYKIEHKQMDWTEAFNSARQRTQNVFSNDLWPYLIVIYEME